MAVLNDLYCPRCKTHRSQMSAGDRDYCAERDHGLRLLDGVTRLPADGDAVNFCGVIGNVVRLTHDLAIGDGCYTLSVLTADERAIVTFRLIPTMRDADAHATSWSVHLHRFYRLAEDYDR